MPSADIQNHYKLNLLQWQNWGKEQILKEGLTWIRGVSEVPSAKSKVYNDGYNDGDDNNNNNNNIVNNGARRDAVVEALRFKSEGRGFDSR